MFNEGGLIKRAEQAKNIHEQEKAREKLAMKLGEYSIDIHKERINETNKRNEYLLKKLQELDSEAKEAEDTKYFEVNVDGWIFWVNKENLEIEAQGEEKNPLVRIKEIKLTTGINSIKVDIEVSRAEGAKYKYYYKKQDSTEAFKLAKETKDTSYPIENLEQNVTYVIKVEATNANGTASKEAIGRTGEIPTAQGAIEFGSLSWNNGKAEVTITKTTSDSMKIQYRVTVGENIGEYQEITSGEKITNLELGSIVTARLWDGINGGNTTSLNVEDLIAPEITEYNATISGNVITASMSATDNTGITPTYEYKIEGGNYQKANTFIISEAKTYKIYFRATDKSGNQTEKTKDVTAGCYTVTYDANGGEGAPSSQTAIVGTEITLSTQEPTRAAGGYYEFLGWSTNNTATTAEYAKGAKITKTSNITLYAVWKEANIKGAFIKYDVEYTDTYKNYEYTSINGWRLENYELSSDGKSLSNVRLISTGVPAMMYYYYNDTTNNYSKWITDNTKLTEFKNNVLGTDYTTYTYKGPSTYYALQASAGYYYNLGQMTFEQGTTYDKYNQGYYTKIKNGNTTYTSGETTGDNLFKARNDANIRMLTLPEINRALGRDDIDSIISITDTTGLYRLDQISIGTALTSNTYNNSYYWLASPYPDTSYYSRLCCVAYDGSMDYSSSGRSGPGVRPLVSLTSKVQLVKKTDASGFVYYEMVNVN